MIASDMTESWERFMYNVNKDIFFYDDGRIKSLDC